MSRGHARDKADIAAMCSRGKIEPQRLVDLVQQVEAQISRYPNLCAEALLERVRTWNYELDDA